MTLLIDADMSAGERATSVATSDVCLSWTIWRCMTISKVSGHPIFSYVMKFCNFYVARKFLSILLSSPGSVLGHFFASGSSRTRLDTCQSGPGIDTDDNMLLFHRSFACICVMCKCILVCIDICMCFGSLSLSLSHSLSLSP